MQDIGNFHRAVGGLVVSSRGPHPEGHWRVSYIVFTLGN